MSVPVGGEDEIADLGRAFNDMSAELQRAREAHRHFLESVSHELRTPLTSIRGYAEALSEDAVDQVEGGRVIAAEASRLERLVADLLELARFERAGFSVRREPLDLLEVAEQVVRRHAPRARELAVELRRRGEGGRTGAGRFRPAAAGGVEPDRERAAADPTGGDRDGEGRPGRA